MNRTVTTIALSVVLLLSMATTAHASSLTQGQVSAVVSLLQSFGVDQQTLTSVEATLDGTKPTMSIAFSAAPTSGSAPLTVSFSASGLTSGTYIIEYGDGQTSGPLSTIAAPCSTANTNQCNPTITNGHTYYSPGSYTATLSPYIACLYSNPRCMIAQQAPIGSATVSVIGQSTGSLSISGLDAPSQLNVGQAGTWTVHVSSASGQLSYSVVWGDEDGTITSNSASLASAVNASGTFTHTYATTGTYRPVFTVSGANGSAQASATIVVGSSSPVPCVEMPINIGFGSSGPEVVTLQQSLGVSPTGYFGPLTKAAVTQWQYAHNVLATGYVGPLTRAAMLSWTCPGSTVQVYSLLPNSGSTGTTLSLTGFGFTSDNTVLFDGIVAARNVPIASSIAVACTTDPNCHPGIRQTLTVTVPTAITPNCPTGSACPMYARLVTPGQYNVSVQNENGTSNTALFTVIAGTSQ